jgi:glycosyltransferase involved in cell wall biosynthesis
MKIVIVTNNYFPTMGGISTYVHDLVEELKNQGQEIYLFYPNRRNYFNFFSKISFVLKTLNNIKKKIENDEIIINSHSANYCLLIGILCKLFYNAKVIHTYHTPVSKKYLSFYLTRFADTLIYVSIATRNLYQKFGVKPHPNEIIIPGGIDTTKFLPGNILNDDIFRILFVGRISKEKGIIELIKAIEIIRDYNIKVSIVGTAQNKVQFDYFKRVKELVLKLKLKGIIEFTGKIVGDKLIRKYSESKIFVCPSICEESAPMVIAEALSCGLPVVAFNTGGLAERITNKINGILVEKHNINDFANSIKTLIEDNVLYKKMRNAARTTAVEELDKSNMTEKYIELFKELLNNGDEQ